MSTSRSIPEGLKPQECETSPEWNKAPNSYILAAQESSNDNILKVKVSDKVMLSFAIYHQGTPEQFLGHVQMALQTVYKCGLYAAYQLACKEYLEAIEKLVTATVAKEKICQ